MLRYLLDSHPNIVCHGEVFKGKSRIRSLLSNGKRYQLTHPYEHFKDDFGCFGIKDFINRQLLYAPTADIIASGFKFKTDEFFLSAFRDVATVIEEDTDIKMVHLKRRSLLAQYVSHQLVLQKQTATKILDETKLRPLRPINISQKDLFKFLKDVVGRENRIVEILKEHDVIEVEYEKLMEPNSSEVDAIQSFLHVNIKELNTPTLKVVSDYKKLVLNYAQVSNWIVNSKYAHRL